MRAVLIRALQFESVRDNAVIPAETQAAKLQVPTEVMKLLLNPTFHPGGQPDIVQKDAKHDECEEQKKNRDATPFEGGKENAPAPAADRFVSRLFVIGSHG